MTLNARLSPRMRRRVGRFCFGTRRSDALMGHYRKIDPRLWNDEKFRCFDFFAQDLWLYILTNPQTNQVGLYVWRDEFALADLLPRWHAAATFFAETARVNDPRLDDNVFECLCGTNDSARRTAYYGT